MQKQIEESINQLLVLTLYHNQKIIKESRTLEKLIHNNPDYREISDIIHEMDQMATAIHNMDVTARLGAGLRYESKQQELKKAYEKLKHLRD